MEDPIMNIEWRHVDTLDQNAWNPNVVQNAELRLLEHSLLTMGWIQPILINNSGIIIDGFHRWSLSRDSKAIRARYDGNVPCAVIDVDDDHARAMTVRINRAKGTHRAQQMSEIAKHLAESGWTQEMIAKEMGMSAREVELLLSDTIYKHRKLNNVKYSPSWEPKKPNSSGKAGQ